MIQKIMMRIMTTKMTMILRKNPGEVVVVMETREVDTVATRVEETEQGIAMMMKITMKKIMTITMKIMTKKMTTGEEGERADVQGVGHAEVLVP